MILMRTLCDNRRVGVMLMLMLGVVLLFLMSLLHGSVNIPIDEVMAIVLGEPSKASAEKGEKVFARCAELAVDAMNDAFAYMAAKERFNYSNF